MRKRSPCTRVLSMTMVLILVLSFAAMGAGCTQQQNAKNLALGLLENPEKYEYIITGGGTGFDSTNTMHEDGTRYTVSELENESLIRLTDGVILNDEQQHFATGWESHKWNDMTSQRSKYVEFYRNESRYLTIDLGQISNITELDMHFGAVDGYGIYLPVEVTYYLSEDGSTFYKVGTVDVEQAQADENDSRNTADEGELMLNHAYYRISDISYNARYVKIMFPMNVYAFADELSVMGIPEASGKAANLTTLEKWDPNAGVVNHYATYEQSGGVRNEYMAYSGWYIYSDDETRTVAATHKNQDEYLSAVAYVAQDGTITDWMFDDLTVMGHEYTAQGAYNAYHEGHTDPAEYATKDDWAQWLNYAFGMDAEGNTLTVNSEGEVSTAADGAPINLVALNAAVAQAKDALNDPDSKVGVTLVMWPAVHVQNNWGELDGQKLDFTIEGAGSKDQAIANRLAAEKWYVDTAIAMWEAAGFEHLELTGFYYYEETIRMSSDRAAKGTAQAITEYVKTVTPPTTNTKESFSADTGRLYIYWLPYYQSEGFTQWAEFGFDYALMQPNYAFYDIYTVQQLHECGQLCETYGLGMQMEFGGINKGYIRKFEDYLTFGGEIGYQNTVLSWYMSTYGCYQTSQNEEETRYLYDAIYQFINGGVIDMEQMKAKAEQAAGPENLALGKIPTFGYTEEVEKVTYWTVNEINGAMGLLTDGDNASPNWWVNSIDNYYIGIDCPSVTGPYSVTIDLEEACSIGSLAMYFYDSTDWGVGTTQSVEYFVSADGENWTSAGVVNVADAIATEIVDERNPDEQAPTLYNFLLETNQSGIRYVKAVFAADHPSVTRLGIGEIEVYSSDSAENTNLALGKAPSFEYTEELEKVTYWTVNEINGAMGLLTDGDNSSPNWWVNSIDNYYIGIDCPCVTGPYAVVLDLGDSYDLSRLDMYFYDRTDWGVGTAQNVEYLVSVDGENWTSAGVVSVTDAIATEIEDERNPDEQAPTLYNFQLNMDLSGIRYVKAVFEADHPSVNRLGIGEFEVYGK